MMATMTSCRCCHFCEAPVNNHRFCADGFHRQDNSWDNFLNRDKRRHLSAVEIKQLAAAGSGVWFALTLALDLSLLER